MTLNTRWDLIYGMHAPQWNTKTYWSIHLRKRIARGEGSENMLELSEREYSLGWPPGRFRNKT